MKKLTAIFRLILKILRTVLIIPLGLLFIAIFLYSVISLSHYYSVRMVLPIEWKIDDEELYGKKISANFIEMEQSYYHPEKKRTFIIGKTKRLVLPHSLFIFDERSVKPDDIKLALDNPEVLNLGKWDEAKQKWDYSEGKIIFYVSKSGEVK